MSDYVHGSADTTGQEETFDGFIRWMIRVGVFAVAILIFMAVFNS